MKILNHIIKCPVATLDEITDFSTTNNIEIPIDFINFLTSQNAVSTVEKIFALNEYKVFYVHDFYPLGNCVKSTLQLAYSTLKHYFEERYLPFACDPGGWQFIISIQKDDFGSVYFCRMDETLDSALTFLSASFSSFIDRLEPESFIMEKSIQKNTILHKKDTRAGKPWRIEKEGEKIFLHYLLSTQGGGTKKVEINNEIHQELLNGELKLSEIIKKHNLY